MVNHKKIFRYLTILVFLAIAIWFTLGYSYKINFDSIRQLVDESGAWGPVIFVMVYITVVVFSLPAAGMTLAGGLLFGTLWGGIFSLTGAMIGATISFFLARYIASDWVRRRSGKFLKRVLHGIKHSGWRFVAVIRLIPVFPFAIVNYLLGLTPVSFKGFWFASTIFMLPGVFAYAYVGSLGEAVIRGEGKQIIGKIF